MIRARFAIDDLASVRFAISPLMEAMSSVRALHDPAAQALHLPWVQANRDALAAHSIQPVVDLLTTGGYSPDFLHPPPSSPTAVFEDELARMAATPPDEVRREVRVALRGRGVPSAVRPLLDSPAGALQGIVEAVRAYWAVTLEPHWARIRALLDGDVLYRARKLTEGGARALFADVDPTVRWRRDTLCIEKAVELSLDLAGQGLLLVPSVFTGPRVAMVTAAPWQPTLIYPARGVGALWDRDPAPAPEHLAALIGERRARILLALGSPRSTTELAALLGMSAGGVSQHLGVLRGAGLVNAHRTGRVVLYAQSARAHVLTAAEPFIPSQPAARPGT
jgi:DNA-binding transcriptional ArsR family regulator